MKKKVLKVKWKNLIKLLMLIIAVSVVLHDAYMMVINPIFTGISYGLTYVGILSWLGCFFIISGVLEDLEEQIKMTDTCNVSVKKYEF